jgi:hypothetical protein
MNVTLTDQYVTDMAAIVDSIVYYGVPVMKIHAGESPTISPNRDIAFYAIAPKFDKRGIPITKVSDQFIRRNTMIDHFIPVYLGAPSQVRTE